MSNLSLFMTRLVTLFSGLCLAAWAAYPDKPIKLIVPFPPGAGTDATARLLANALQTQLNQSIVVENRAGGGGSIGAQSVVESPADGYTLFFATTGTLAFNQHLYAKLKYNPATDFTPIAGIASFNNVLVVHPELPVKNVQELIALAKSKPGQLTYASSGTGSSSHLAVILFESLTDTSFTHVPYKGTTPALADLLSGRVDFALDNMTTYAPLAKQGKVKALGLSGPNPSGFLPGVPALQSSGVPGYNMVLWYAVMGPKNMPPEIVSKLSEDIKIILAQPKVKQALEALGNDAMYMPSKDIESFIRNESAKWGGIVKRAGVKPE